MNIEFTGKKVFVCGASEGIGFAIARRFALSGAEVVISSSSQDKLSAAAGRIADEAGREVGFIAADFSSPESAIEQIIAKFPEPGFSILVNNTGGPKAGLLNEDDPEKLQAAFSQHVIFSQMLTGCLLPFMKQQGFGRVLNITSIGAKQPVFNLGTSNVIRGAMTAWAKTLSKELGQYGITVNNILPGHTLTGRLMSLIETNAGKAGISTEEMQKKMIADIPVGRLGQPDDMASLALFLSSEYASFITGVNIPVDGGYLSCL